jgi:hypothetical protein
LLFVSQVETNTTTDLGSYFSSRDRAGPTQYHPGHDNEQVRKTIDMMMSSFLKAANRLSKKLKGLEEDNALGEIEELKKKIEKNQEAIKLWEKIDNEFRRDKAVHEKAIAEQKKNRSYVHQP